MSVKGWGHYFSQTSKGSKHSVKKGRTGQEKHRQWRGSNEDGKAGKQRVISLQQGPLLSASCVCAGKEKRPRQMGVRGSLEMHKYVFGKKRSDLEYVELINKAVCVLIFNNIALLASIYKTLAFARLNLTGINCGTIFLAAINGLISTFTQNSPKEKGRFGRLCAEQHVPRRVLTQRHDSHTLGKKMQLELDEQMHQYDADTWSERGET